jgi:hypothetical protein
MVANVQASVEVSKLDWDGLKLITFIKDFPITNTNSFKLTDKVEEYGYWSQWTKCAGAISTQTFEVERSESGVTIKNDSTLDTQYNSVFYPNNLELNIKGKTFRLVEVVERCLAKDILRSGVLMRFEDEKGDMYLTTNLEINPLVELTLKKTITQLNHKTVCAAYWVVDRPSAKSCAKKSAISEAKEMCELLGGRPNASNIKINYQTAEINFSRNYIALAQVECTVD